MKRLVIGILAHVDSGKTTLSEALLYAAGTLKSLGRVDHGNAFLDTDIQERQRGITIFSKQAVLNLHNAEFTLLDTPGHVDFSPEMERTLQVLDYAILVISGTDGVQSHTETLWQLLKQHRIPTFLFINKMDLPGADRDVVFSDLQRKLGAGCIDFSGEFDEETLDQLAMCQEDLMEDYLETGTVQEAHVLAAIRRRNVFPCCFGSALRTDGVPEFLECMERYTLEPEHLAKFGARVFKIARDDQGNRLTYLKVLGGKLPVKSMLKGKNRGGGSWEEKVNSLRRYSGEKYTQLQEALPGMIVAATGLTETYPGLGFGTEAAVEKPMLQPVLTYRVLLPEGTDPHTALTRLRQIEEEEPMLHVTWNEGLQELRVQIMGQVQLEILREMILRRFEMDAAFVQGSIIYQETIANTVEGVGHFEPLRHYAEVHLLMEPGKRGSGVQFFTACDEDELDRNWQRLIQTNLQEKAHLGVLLGVPITDIKITLVAGKAHLKHTEGGDFRQATYRAVRQGLMQAESVLLEPWFAYRLEVPMGCVGRAMTDLQKMNGTFQQGDTMDGMTVLTGRAPVACMQDYQLEVAGYTHGRGRLICTPDGYDVCHNQQEIVEAAGYDPEADLENTPDSVFCSHGAGTVIKWYEVPEYMHLPSCIQSVPEGVEEEKTWELRAREYYQHAATDKELQAIFERTYGPIKRDARSTMRTVRTENPQKKQRPSLAPTGPEYVLVDGYNIIFAWERLKRMAQDSLEAARTELINILCNYQGIRQCKLILVFDAYKVKGNHGSVEKVGDISVVYTKEAETADMYIERVTHEIGRKHRVRVATSDGLEQIIILGHGALRVSASMFEQEVNLAEKAMRDFLSRQE